MANQRSASQQNEKKLAKRKRRLQQRLQEAQAAYHKAMDRFKRASARLQKRRTRLQRMEQRLSDIRQQAHIPSSAAATPATPPQVTVPVSPQSQQESVAATSQDAFTQETQAEQRLLSDEAQAAASAPVEDVQQEQALLDAELQAAATAPVEDIQQEQTLLRQELEAEVTAPVEDTQQEQTLLDKELQAVGPPVEDMHQEQLVEASQAGATALAEGTQQEQEQFEEELQAEATAPIESVQQEQEQLEEELQAEVPAPIESVQQEQEQFEEELQAEVPAPIESVQQEQEQFEEELQAEATAPVESVQQEQELLDEELRVAATPPSASPIPVSPTSTETSVEELSPEEPTPYESIPEEPAAQEPTPEEPAAQEPAPEEPAPSPTPARETAEPSSTPSNVATETMPETSRTVEPDKRRAEPVHPLTPEYGSLVWLVRAVVETAERAARLAMQRALERAFGISHRTVPRASSPYAVQEPAQVQSEVALPEVTIPSVEQATQTNEAPTLTTATSTPLITHEYPESISIEAELAPTEEASVIETEPPSAPPSPSEETHQESASASMLVDIEQEQQTLPSEDEIQAQLSSLATEPASAALEDEVQIPVVEPELPSWVTQTEEPAEPDVSPTPTSAEATTPASIEEIEDEEDMISGIAALMVADVAAAAAAKAEAIAEASSARTREARFLAMQADQVVEEVRTAISNHALTGAEAESYLQEAERNAMRAHAFLADAEAAEEQALNAARNAEAEAEVTEGMAFAASKRGDTAGKTVSSATLQIEDADVIIGDDDELEEPTRKRSAISPQLSQSSQEQP